MCSVDYPEIVLPLIRFLTIQECPLEWRLHDLYLVRDDEIVFYVGQSYVAFQRVWTHLLDGFKGRSEIGRFVLCNWPRSMHLVVELLCSQSSRFELVGNDVDRAERTLIEQLAPCFNRMWNSQPTPLPSHYVPPGAPSFRRPRSPKRMIRQAESVLRFEGGRTGGGL